MTPYTLLLVIKFKPSCINCTCNTVFFLPFMTLLAIAHKLKVNSTFNKTIYKVNNFCFVKIL